MFRFKNTQTFMCKIIGVFEFELGIFFSFMKKNPLSEKQDIFKHIKDVVMMEKT